MCNECFQAGDEDDIICTSCSGGLMPEFSGDICIPRFSNCADADLDDQPEGLSVHPMWEMFYCETCEDGYYWDEDLFICGECSVENCELCSSYGYCDVCNEGFFVQLDKTSCIPPIENCKVPTSIQPQGLIKNHEEGRYECAVCKTGFTFNSETALCDHCSDSLPGCLICQDQSTCLQCKANHDLEDGQCIDQINIANCEEVDPIQQNLCVKCTEGFGLSYNQRKCSPCSNIDEACTSCESEYKEATICTNCLPPTELVDGTCEWTGCESWFVGDSEAYCEDCLPGYSLFENSCVECTSDMLNNTEYWHGCDKCDINDNGEPFDCLSCLNDDHVLLTVEETPISVCAYPRIFNCIEQEWDEAECEECEVGFYNAGTECTDCASK